MASVPVRTLAGADAGSVQLDDRWFGAEPNVPLMHQVVTAQLAARRSGTQSTLTRSEVRGGGAKPWRQKGTGRARQGSIRAPQWQGGGVALGPKPRSYAQKTPKKMIRAALVSALSDRAAGGRVAVAADWRFDAPKTACGCGRCGPSASRVGCSWWSAPPTRSPARSFRNLPHVHLLTPGQLNAYDVAVLRLGRVLHGTRSRAAGPPSPASATTVSVGGAATGSAPADPTTDAGDEA
jgi:large subunit ribosomal protein L4